MHNVSPTAISEMQPQLLTVVQICYAILSVWPEKLVIST